MLTLAFWPPISSPDQITIDVRKNFVSKEFQQYVNTMGITLKAVPVEAYNFIGTVERYHGLVRRAYQIIITEIRDIDKEMALQMAFKAVNDLPYLIPTTELNDIELPEVDTEDVEEEENSEGNDLTITVLLPTQLIQLVQLVKRGRGRLYDTTVFTQDEHQYTASQQAEISGLLEKGVFEIALVTDMPEGWQIENVVRGLRFVKLDKNTLQLLVFTDASFANNKDLSSQIGYVLALADGEGNANILHWSSIKCKRVTWSVLTSELYGMAHGFDMGASIKSTIDKALKISLPLVLCTDSKSLYDCLVKLGTTQEKRLMIDVMCLRQAYERREIAEVKWIQGTTNPADSMTKEKSSNALKQLVDTNKVQLKVVEWVEREGSGSKV
ncbi:hypothetical protein B7463_g6637, partial [Scytalidium lignicola]